MKIVAELSEIENKKTTKKMIQRRSGSLKRLINWQISGYKHLIRLIKGKRKKELHDQNKK